MPTLDSLQGLVRRLVRRRGGADAASGGQRSGDDARGTAIPASLRRNAPESTVERAAYLALLEGARACTAGDHIAAMDAFQRSLVAFLQADARDDAALVQKIIGLLFMQIKDPDTVRTACANARMTLEQAGLRDEAVRVLAFLGDFETRTEAFREATNAYRAALSLVRAMGDVDGEVDVLCRYAASQTAWGRPSEGRSFLGQALKAAKEAERDDLVALVETRAAHILGDGDAPPPVMNTPD